MSALKLSFNKPHINLNLINQSKRFLTNLAINYNDNTDDYDYYYNPEIKYNKQFKFFYEKLTPIAVTQSLCPLCKGSGWITKNNFNLNIIKKQTSHQFQYNLCNACNGKGLI